jgi:NAD(P)H-dependent flavin oxidoreductase YrpB (nitropropane dioxygenase family)
MPTGICRRLGIQYPIFAFSHCRDVVAAVTRAGGLGVYGVSLQTPDLVAVDLDWIEAEVGDRPYGIDILLSRSADAAGEAPPSDRHHAFLDGVMARYRVPADPEGIGDLHGNIGIVKLSPRQNAEILEMAFARRARVLVSALGTPSPEVLARAHDRGMLVGALAGKARHAVRHRDAGVDFVVAQSWEAGGHTGEIGGMVLIPEVVDAVAPLPVLAAGGIATGRQMAAALALGAEGVWCGSVWLTSTESETLPVIKRKMLAAGSDDTIRTRSLTGKPVRMLKTAWTDAWHAPGAPDPLPAPHQSALIGPYYRRASAASAGAEGYDDGPAALVTTPVGQVVALMRESLSTRRIVQDMIDGFAATTARLAGLFDDA